MLSSSFSSIFYFTNERIKINFLSTKQSTCFVISNYYFACRSCAFSSYKHWAKTKVEEEFYIWLKTKICSRRWFKLLKVLRVSVFFVFSSCYVFSNFQNYLRITYFKNSSCLFVMSFDYSKMFICSLYFENCDFAKWLQRNEYFIFFYLYVWLNFLFYLCIFWCKIINDKMK